MPRTKILEKHSGMCYENVTIKASCHKDITMLPGMLSGENIL